MIIKMISFGIGIGSIVGFGFMVEWERLAALAQLIRIIPADSIIGIAILIIFLIVSSRPIHRTRARLLRYLESIFNKLIPDPSHEKTTPSL